MRLLEEEFTAHNFKGVLGLRDHLRLTGTLSMPSACTGSYLLRDGSVTAPNEFW
ncbi:hypothetical protein [Hymenobacter siberiensis]|uniref:hypothetical protein n=1 Tax=Hymenobacter siberiensis TaxID=2848396 RepID=UPI001C1E5638